MLLALYSRAFVLACIRTFVHVRVHARALKGAQYQQIANVMFGQHNSAVSCFKEKVPNIFVLRCICHSAHLCASHACEKLPHTAEDLIHDVYNYFSYSTKQNLV